MPPQHIDAKSIIGDIEQHNEYFDNLVDIIPANVYVVDTSNNQSTYHQSKHQKKQGKDSKEAKKAEAKRAKAKIGKLKKFDPAQQESTRAKKMRVENAEDDDSDNDSMEGIQFQDNHEEEQEDHKSPKGSNGSKPNKSKSSAHQSRIEDLRSKLRAKLEERKSNSVTNSTSNTMVSKRAARRAEKKKKIEMTKKRQAQSKVSGGSTVTGKFGVASIKIVQDLGGSKINAESKPKDVVDDLVGIDLGGIAGLKDDLLTKGKYSAVNKSLKNMGKKKSLERLLEEAEAKKERLRQLKASDDIEDKEKAKKIEWGDALKAARYVSVNFSLENYRIYACIPSLMFSCCFSFVTKWGKDKKI
jgi:hypothetical protein